VLDQWGHVVTIHDGAAKSVGSSRGTPDATKQMRGHSKMPQRSMLVDPKESQCVAILNGDAYLVIHSSYISLDCVMMQAKSHQHIKQIIG
jgi:hypothetical protein